MTYAEADTAYRAAHAAFQPIKDGFLAGSVSDADYFAARATFEAARDALDAAEAELPETDDAEVAEVFEDTQTGFAF